MNLHVLPFFKNILDGIVGQIEVKFSFMIWPSINLETKIC